MLPCEGKRAYRTPMKATVAAKGRMRDGVEYLRIYHCPHCDLYHLTSMRETEAKRIAATSKWPERTTT